ncbi:MAG: TetR/AcrR family transcriptional regulator [Eubacteriales bacterium]|nr:TetR/AcrR family transcriptional regulator [Eubacteriales bacterium]
MNGHQMQKEQSRKMIQDALFGLMEEKGFAQVTVSEIVEKADVARRTFYRLYHDKMDVIRFYFRELCRDYGRRYKPLQSYDIGKIAEEYFGFWYQHREFLLLLHKSGLDDVLYYEISRASAEVVGKRIGSGEAKKAAGVEYFVRYTSGGFLNLLYCWIMDGMQETPENYAENVRKVLLQFIRPV